MNLSVMLDWLPALVRFALSCVAFVLVIALMGRLRRPSQPRRRREPPPLTRPAARRAGSGDGGEARS